MPLHIFEPRYRQMVIDAATTGNYIGMALLKEGWQENYYGNPAIYPLGCVGRMVSRQTLPDGRSNIMLQGLCRYKILEEECESAPYRQARIVPLPEDISEPLPRKIREALLVNFNKSLPQSDGGQAWVEGPQFEPSDEVLVNILSSLLDFTPLEKQLLLEADTVLQRARRLGDLLQFKQYERDDRKGRG